MEYVTGHAPSMKLRWGSSIARSCGFVLDIYLSVHLTDAPQEDRVSELMRSRLNRSNFLPLPAP